MRTPRNMDISMWGIKSHTKVLFFHTALFGGGGIGKGLKLRRGGGRRGSFEDRGKRRRGEETMLLSPPFLCA